MANLVSLDSYRKVFLGKQCGVGLNPRGEDDLHVCFTLLSEDDENWFTMSENGMSSFWFDDLVSITQEAMAWCKANCDQDIDDNGNVWGWKFRS